MSKEFKEMKHIKNIKSGKTDGYAAVGISNNIGLDLSFADEITNKMITDLSDKKDKIILKRLKELDIKIDFDLDAKRRFKRFTNEIKGNEETLYFDDGSIDGLRIVTFVTKDIPIDFTNEKVSVGYDISYY